MPSIAAPFDTYHPAILAYVLNSIRDVHLEQAIRAIQGGGRRLRKLFGADGILDRTLGVDATPETLAPFDPYICKIKYFDLERSPSRESFTEFGEAKEALAKLDTRAGIENAVAVLKEVGDIRYQETVMKLGHATDSNIHSAATQFNQAFGYLDAQLRRYDLSLTLADLAARVTYAVRGMVLNADKCDHRQPNKHKPFEFAILLYTMKKENPGRFGSLSELDKL
ncbi:MAG TPA: hypothetical protein VJJ82_01160 [Candidatus Nanoarchaeia archaeon]|nr:hypothetical protein [Candidatus Nanoarchaeia archaeon]